MSAAGCWRRRAALRLQGRTGRWSGCMTMPAPPSQIASVLAPAAPVPMRSSAAAHFPPRLQAMLRGSLQKMFGPWDTLFLGVGIVIGSGWAQVGLARRCWQQGAWFGLVAMRGSAAGSHPVAPVGSRSCWDPRCNGPLGPSCHWVLAHLHTTLNPSPRCPAACHCAAAGLRRQDLLGPWGDCERADLRTGGPADRRVLWRAGGGVPALRGGLLLHHGKLISPLLGVVCVFMTPFGVSGRRCTASCGGDQATGSCLV